MVTLGDRRESERKTLGGTLAAKSDMLMYGRTRTTEGSIARKGYTMPLPFGYRRSYKTSYTISRGPYKQMGTSWMNREERMAGA